MSSPVTAVLDLRERLSSWDISALLAPRPEELWGQRQLVPVADLAQLLAPRSEAEDDEPVVTPGAVDVQTGDVSTRRGRAAHRLVLRVGAVTGAAQVGDVLVPQLGNAPCVLVGQQHRGLSFVNFVALRPEMRTTGLWLWAALTSSSGCALRRTVTVGTSGRLPLTVLLNTPIPEPPPLDDPRYVRIAALHDRTRVSAKSEGHSWWHVATLPLDGQWHLYLATPAPEVFDEGTPLGQLVTVLGGRTPQTTFERPRPGAVPVLNGRSVDGQHVTRWADPGAGTNAEPGDIAVVEIGIRGRAAVVTQPAIAGTGVLLLKPHDRSLGEALAAYLRSEPAQTLRATLTTGGVIPRLSRSTLAQLPVPDEALTASGTETSSPAEASTSLSEQLEQLLWS